MITIRPALPDVVTIADEVDAQLKQQMLRYMAASAVEGKPTEQIKQAWAFLLLL